MRLCSSGLINSVVLSDDTTILEDYTSFIFKADVSRMTEAVWLYRKVARSMVIQDHKEGGGDHELDCAIQYHGLGELKSPFSGPILTEICT
jgi:hypothetical protein